MFGNVVSYPLGFKSVSYNGVFITRGNLNLEVSLCRLSATSGKPRYKSEGLQPKTARGHNGAKP